MKEKSSISINTGEEKKALVEKIYYILAGILIFMFFWYAQVAIGSKVYAAVPNSVDDTEAKYIGMLVTNVVFDVLLYYILRTRYHRPINKTRFKARIISTIFFAFGIQAMTLIIYFMCSAIIPEPTKSYVDGSAVMQGLTPVSIAYITILAPIFEEFLFRGVITREIQKGCCFWVANIIQALLFALYHRNLFQAIYTFLFGLLLGCIACKRGDIRYSISLHIIYNIIGLTPYTDMLSKFGLLLPLIIGAIAPVIGTSIFVKDFFNETDKEDE